MCQLIQVVTITVFFSTVNSLKPLAHGRERPQNNAFKQLLSKVRRDANKDNLETIMSLYKKITKGMKPDEIKEWLRHDMGNERIEVQAKPERLEDDDVQLDQAAIVEAELKDALENKKSALLDHPYVEKKGKNDFLVLRPEVLDPFVTVIPNAIYYNIEKKCVNWLDDCSLRGIRARLLHGVHSPYR